MMFRFADAFLPYAIVEVRPGDWIAVNREYKPVGMLTNDWVEWGHHPAHVFRFKSVAAESRALRLMAEHAPKPNADIFGRPGFRRVYFHGTREAISPKLMAVWLRTEVVTADCA